LPAACDPRSPQRRHHKVPLVGRLMGAASGVQCPADAVPIRFHRQRGRARDLEEVREQLLDRHARGVDLDLVLRARKVSGWPKRCKLAHAFL
jgi:hypothetical protein